MMNLGRNLFLFWRNRVSTREQALMIYFFHCFFFFFSCSLTCWSKTCTIVSAAKTDTQKYAFNTKDYLTTPPARYMKFSPPISMFSFVHFPHSASCTVNLFFSVLSVGVSGKSVLILV